MRSQLLPNIFICVLLIVLAAASIAASVFTVVEGGHQRSDPGAAMAFLALLGTASIFGVARSLSLTSKAVDINLSGKHWIVWILAGVSGLRPLVIATLYPWRRIVLHWESHFVEWLLTLCEIISWPADLVVYLITGSSLYADHLLPTGFVKRWLLAGTVSVAFWSAVGMLLILGVQRRSPDGGEPL